MDFLRAPGIILTVAGLVVYILLAIRHPKSRLYLIAPLSWLLFTLSFLVVSYGNQLGLWNIESATLNIWSASVRLYSLCLVLGIGLVWLAKPMGELPYDLN
jgi:hypothetical protein